MSTRVAIPEDLLVFNGIDGKTGQYLVPPMTAQRLVEVILSEKAAERDARAREWKQFSEQQPLAPAAGLNPKRLDEVGWGVVFPASLAQETVDAIRDALGELLQRRRQQAGGLYKEFVGGDGYRRGENAKEWLRRHNSGFGRVDPRTGAPPYYLLIVGDPNTIPYAFQYNLDVDRAVGRIHFESLQEYANYARSVVAAETGRVARSRRAVLFGVTNPGDRATGLSTQHLIQPLLDGYAKKRAKGTDAEKAVISRWTVDAVLGDDATRSRLLRLMGGDQSPALLFTASHGIGFPAGDPGQVEYQGALICQDWPGPYGGGIRREHYLAAEDIDDDASPLGMINFHFACFGAGTPFNDEFYQLFNRTRSPIAPYAFLARLPRRLLAHPKGGALAVIGHIERAWTHSFKWGTSRDQTTDFSEVLYQLMDGYPVGYAMEAINTRYASISAQLSHELQEHEFSPRDPQVLADLWTGNNDARGYAIVGDPAVTLAVAAEGATAVERAAIEVASPRPGTLPPVLDEKSDPRLAAPTSFTPAAGGAETAEDFGVTETLGAIGDSLNKALASLASGLQSLTDLQVRTFIVNQIDPKQLDAAPKDVTGAQLRALTRVTLTGNTDTIVPMSQGQLDNVIWTIHKDTVGQAWQNRAELLRILTEMIQSLIPKPGS
jgi:hypothetical protein